jgi:CRP-like cAMP-binding protein
LQLRFPTTSTVSSIELKMVVQKQDARKLVSTNGDELAVSQATTNLILNTIPQREYEVIRPSLEPVSLEWHAALNQAKEPIEYGYFPNGGVISLVVPLSDGRSAEVGMVGREGFIGAPLAGGLDRSPHLAMVQVPSTALRIRAGLLRKVLPSTPQLATLLTRYALVQGMQLAQTAACNRLHNLEQRLARWLLMSQDRVKSNVLPYTQDLLAVMLGTDRPSVCIAVGVLQKKGSVKQKRGNVDIVDRSLLKISTCECYEVIQEFNRGLEPELA